MFLSGALFILFLAGCWLLCLADVATTPAAKFPGLSKRGWIAVIAATFIVGAVAWYLTRARHWQVSRWRRKLASHATLGQYDGEGFYPGGPITAEAALARHPASQAWRASGPIRTVPIGPDDDPEFLRMLDRLISGGPDSSELPILPSSLQEAHPRTTGLPDLKNRELGDV